jgi:hypothetical protein
MAKYKGLFKLKDAQDLLGKLRHDFDRLQASPTDTYAAFDFLMYHLLHAAGQQGAEL